MKFAINQLSLFLLRIKLHFQYQLLQKFGENAGCQAPEKLTKIHKTKQQKDEV